MNDNKPVLKIRNRNFEIAIFKHAYSTESGTRDSYNASLEKSVKNKTTGEWDRYKFSIFEGDMLLVSELIKMAYVKLIAIRNGTPATQKTEPEPINVEALDEWLESTADISF